MYCTLCILRIRRTCRYINVVPHAISTFELLIETLHNNILYSHAALPSVHHEVYRVRSVFCLQFRFADAKDKILIAFGVVFSVLQGAAMPLMIIVFGDMSDLFIYDEMYSNWLDEYWDNISQYTNATQEECLENPDIVV